LIWFPSLHIQNSRAFSIPDPICSQTSQNTLFFTHNLFGIILHIHVSSQFAHILRSIYCNTAFTDQTQIQPIVFLKIYTSANHTTAFPKTPAPSGAILLHMAFFPHFVMCAAVADCACAPPVFIRASYDACPYFYNFYNFYIFISAPTCCFLFFVCCDFLASITQIHLVLFHFSPIAHSPTNLHEQVRCKFVASINHANQVVLLFHYFLPITTRAQSNEQTYTSNPGPSTFLTTHRRR